ncbi:hypothetical protein TNCV_3962201 [Trichonephila clavipes]|nr:hypothetical protein TNCV_3962201 [Trichonephila clavipes]
MSEFNEVYKLIFNASKSITSFYTTDRQNYNYRSVISINDQELQLKRNSPFFQASYQNLITLLSSHHIENQSLRPGFSAAKVLSGVHFHTEFYYPVQKANDNSDFVRQTVLEILSHMPCDALQIYADGSKSDQGHTENDDYINPPSVSLSPISTFHRNVIVVALLQKCFT